MRFMEQGPLWHIERGLMDAYMSIGVHFLDIFKRDVLS